MPGRWRTHMHAYWVRICSHTRDAYAYPILFVFVKHSSKTGTRGGRICFMSRDAYASFPGTHMLRFLGRICARERVDKHSGQFLMHQSGWPKWRNRICCGSACTHEFPYISTHQPRYCTDPIAGTSLLAEADVRGYVHGSPAWIIIIMLKKNLISTILIIMIIPVIISTIAGFIITFVWYY